MGILMQTLDMKRLIKYVNVLYYDFQKNLHRFLNIEPWIVKINGLVLILKKSSNTVIYYIVVS